MVRPWTDPVEPLRFAIRERGIDALIIRVDIEPALDAALARVAFDVVIFDSRTPDVRREVLDTAMRTHRCSAPVIAYDGVEALIRALLQTLDDRRN